MTTMQVLLKDISNNVTAKVFTEEATKPRPNVRGGYKLPVKQLSTKPTCGPLCQAVAPSAGIFIRTYITDTRDRYWKCMLCCTGIMTSEDMLDSHLRGARHAKAVKQKGCANRTTTREQEITEALAERARMDPRFAFVVSASMDEVNGPSLSLQHFTCTLCNLPNLSWSSVVQHCEGKRHTMAFAGMERIVQASLDDVVLAQLTDLSDIREVARSDPRFEPIEASTAAGTSTSSFSFLIDNDGGGGALSMTTHWVCRACNITSIPSNDVKSHCLSTKHNILMDVAQHQADGRFRYLELQGTDGNDDDRNDLRWFCHLCHVMMRVNDCISHAVGKRHTNAFLKINKEDPHTTPSGTPKDSSTTIKDQDNYSLLVAVDGEVTQVQDDECNDDDDGVLTRGDIPELINLSTADLASLTGVDDSMELVENILADLACDEESGLNDGPQTKENHITDDYGKSNRNGESMEEYIEMLHGVDVVEAGMRALML